MRARPRVAFLDAVAAPDVEGGADEILLACKQRFASHG
jgi:hypothetical protein